MNEAPKQTVKWYYRPVWVVVALLAAGPFALPLVWLSPALKKWHKVVMTIAVVAITVWLAKATINILQTIMKEMAELQDSMR